MSKSELQIQTIITTLMKLADKIGVHNDEITLGVLHDTLSVNDLERLKDAVSLVDDISKDERQLLFIQLVSTLLEVVNSDLDRRNVAALIHLKVTLIKLLGYTISIVVIISISISVYTGNGNITSWLSELWKLLEVMFLK